MTPLSQRRRPTATDALPLSRRELADAEAVVSRLRGELLGALEKPPHAGRSALALARELKLNRNICQRVAAGMDSRLDFLQALVKLPGPEGLMLFAEALLAVSGLSAKRSPLIAAVEAYGGFVRAAGGSQARLIRRAELSRGVAVGGEGGGRPSGLAADNVETRRRLFEVAAEMLGYTLDAMTSITALRPIPDSPDFVEGFNAFGLLGVRSLTAPVTLVTSAFHTRDRADDFAEEMKIVPLAGEHPSGLNLIEEFCTHPLPESLVDYAGGTTRTIVEPTGDGRSPIDFVMGRRWRPDVHPLMQAGQRWWQSVGIHRPSRRLVLDVYLHRSMAAACVPALAAYLWHPGLTGNPLQHWGSRLPGKFTLEMLGAGIDNAATEGWPRQQALTSRAFELAGWPGDDFVGYRCDVPYPTWASVYYMMFDFATGQREG